MTTWKDHAITQADYQHWANEVMFTALAHFRPDVIGSDQGLFFQSIHHSIDHILVVSQAWLARLKGESFSPSYKIIHHPDWHDLQMCLRHETRHLQDWLAAQPEAFFEGEIHFAGSDGKPRSMWVRDALAHLFTHYVHHRGQISAVVTRLGGPCLEMDFVYYRREMDKLQSEIKAKAQT